MVEQNYINPILGIQQGWKASGNMGIFDMLLKNVVYVGVMVGSLSAPAVIGFNANRDTRWIVVQLNILWIVSCCIKCIGTFESIFLGRFFFGMSCGTSMPFFSKIMVDTIPNASYKFYGMFLNTGLVFGQFYNNLIQSLVLSNSNEDQTVLMVDNNWRYIYIAEILLCIVNVLVVTLVFPDLSVKDLVAKGRLDEAESFILKVHIIKQEDDVKQVVDLYH